MGKSPYTTDEIRRANRLYDLHNLEELAAKTGIPYGTLLRWQGRGWISTKTNHHAGPKSYSWEEVSRANDLWDRMSLPDVSDVMDVPEGTLRSWARRGWIDTDVNWIARNSGVGKKASMERAVTLVYDHDKQQNEVAEILGVSEATVSRYLKLYREQ